MNDEDIDSGPLIQASEMTLRDLYAYRALAILMTAPQYAGMGQEQIARSAWSMADAMLAARKENQ